MHCAVLVLVGGVGGCSSSSCEVWKHAQSSLTMHGPMTWKSGSLVANKIHTEVTCGPQRLGQQWESGGACVARV